MDQNINNSQPKNTPILDAVYKELSKDTNEGVDENGLRKIRNIIIILFLIIPIIFVSVNSNLRNNIWSNIKEISFFSFLNNESETLNEIPRVTTVPANEVNLCETNELDIENVVINFETAIKSKDAKYVLSLFTQPSETLDKDMYDFLLNLRQSDDGTPNLFKDVNYNFELKDFSLKRDPQEIEQFICKVIVREQRFLPLQNITEDIEVEIQVKKENNEWRIHNYFYSRRDNISSKKYAAFYL